MKVKNPSGVGRPNQPTGPGPPLPTGPGPPGPTGPGPPLPSGPGPPEPTGPGPPLLTGSEHPGPTGPGPPKWREPTRINFSTHSTKKKRQKVKLPKLPEGKWSKEKWRMAYKQRKDMGQLPIRVEKTPLTPEEKSAFGDPIIPNDENKYAMIGFINIQSLPEKRTGRKNFELTDFMNEVNISHIGLAETGRRWGKINQDDRIPFRFRGHFPHGHLATNVSCNTNDNISPSSYQVGGTASLSRGEFISYLRDRGEDKCNLGRYSWQLFQGRGGRTLRIITCYRPCKPSGTNSAYAQQLNFFNKIKRHCCPRKAILDDLETEIKTWKESGDQIILMGDVNEYIESKYLAEWADKLGLRELITERHGKQGPATTRSNKSGKAIDGIWGTLGLSTVAAGYLPYNICGRSDHRLIWIKLCLMHTFGTVLPPMRKPLVRSLRMNDKRGHKAYRKVLKEEYHKHNIPNRMEKLMEDVTFPPTKEKIDEWEDIDRIRMNARKRGLKKSKKMYTSGISSSPPLKKIRLKLRLADLLIGKITNGTKVKQQTLEHLANITDSVEWLELPLKQIQERWRVTRREWYKLKKKDKPTRNTFLEEKIKAHKDEGEEKAAKRLSTQLQQERERDRFFRLRLINKQESRTGVKSVVVEKTMRDANNKIILNEQGEVRTEAREVTQQSELEKECMREVGNRSRMSEESPPMTMPLVEELQYHGMTGYTDDLLRGEAEPIPGIDDETNKLLMNFSALSGDIPEEAKPLPYDVYLKECRELRERTSSGPSIVTPAMVKVEAQDPLLGTVSWQASNFPWCSGYSPSRFRSGLDLLIHKKANDPRLHRLRPILLFDIEANMHNKRLGRIGMEYAEQCNGIAPEQYGGRKNHAPNIQALNQRLFYDQVLLDRKPATSTFIDLVSNYDLVVHSIASLGFQRVGVPKAPVFCTFSTLQDMVHTVRTSYGDSIQSYGGDLWCLPVEPPPQGLGQGNGAGPCSWVLVSTPILNTLRKAGFGAAFKCCISGKKFKLVAYCFVDDTTMVQIAPSPDTPTEETIKIAQKQVDLYEKLIKATGGQISGDKNKNSWYLIEFKWTKSGKWKLIDNAGDIFVNTKSGRKKVNRLPSGTAQEILGVWMSPAGSSVKQKEVLRKKTEIWADRVRSKHIQKQDAWFYYQMTIKKTLEYPLLASTLSEKDCIHIEAPALNAALNCSGLASNFPRDVISGPAEFMGLESPTIYGTTGMIKLRTLLDHGIAATITGNHFRAALERHKLELGCGGSFFENNYKIFHECSTFTWITHLWEFMWKTGAIIVEETSNLQLKRENDVFLMESFAHGGYQGKILDGLNRCRLYLRVTTLSDIASGDGKFIPESYLNGKEKQATSEYNWPPQAKPEKKYWDRWEEAICSVFNLDRRNKLKETHQLGRWTKTGNPTNWMYSQSMDGMYEFVNDQWEIREPVIERRGRDAGRRYHRRGYRSNLPNDSIPAKCIGTRKIVTSTGCMNIIEHSDTVEPTTLKERCREGSSERTWATRNMTVDDNGEYIAEEIRKGRAVAISDGSFDEGRGAAAATIQGKTYNLHAIHGTASCPGMEEDQDAYNAELTGIYMIVSTVEQICAQHNIEEGTITIGCDGIEALKKAMDKDTNYSSRSAQFSLISAIDNKIQKSTINWRWQHVKGHQDDNQGPLDRLATLNVDMDRAAKQKRELDTKNNTTRYTGKIEGEMWGIYCVQPKHNFVQVDATSGTKISNKFDDKLKMQIFGGPLKQYWTDHGVIPSVQVNVDWKAIGRAREKKPFTKRKWESKLSASFIPTGDVMESRNQWPNNECPRKCGTKEDSLHVLKCKRANATWTELQKIVISWCNKNKVAPGIAAALFAGFNKWRGQENMGIEKIQVRDEIKIAYESQDEVGWDAAIRGFLVPEWRYAQQKHNNRIKSRKSSLRVISALIQKIWDVSWDMWQHRNHVLQLGEAEDHFKLINRLTQRISFQYRKGHARLPKTHEFLFNKPLISILASPPYQQVRWLECVTRARLNNARSTHKREDDNIDLQLIKHLTTGGLLAKLTHYKNVPKLKTNDHLIAKRTVVTLERELEE